MTSLMPTLRFLVERMQLDLRELSRFFFSSVFLHIILVLAEIVFWRSKKKTLGVRRQLIHFTTRTITIFAFNLKRYLAR